MKKEFIEYQKSFIPAPNTIEDIANYLTKIKKEYLRERKSNELENSMISKIISNACNRIYSLLYKDPTRANQEKAESLDMEYLITLLFDSFSTYSFEEEQELSKGQKENKTSKEDVANTLIDFLNYIVHQNDYERTFTLKEFKQHYEYIKYKKELFTLRIFLSKVNNYCMLLGSGKNIDSILKDYLDREGVKNISRQDIIYYTPDKKAFFQGKDKNQLEQENQKILLELDAIACAYYKYINGIGSTEAAKNKMIYTKIKKMKKREN